MHKTKDAVHSTGGDDDSRLPRAVADLEMTLGQLAVVVVEVLKLKFVQGEASRVDSETSVVQYSGEAALVYFQHNRVHFDLLLQISSAMRVLQDISLHSAIERCVQGRLVDGKNMLMDSVLHSELSAVSILAEVLVQFEQSALLAIFRGNSHVTSALIQVSCFDTS